ncbi:hypothetical protein SAMN02982918_2616 [Saccharomonospora viridis]|jgi:hypothetical protein|nr:hypothetical protein SAMN02982918_2616 [Saccharomonospora viridis]
MAFLAVSLSGRGVTVTGSPGTERSCCNGGSFRSVSIPGGAATAGLNEPNSDTLSTRSKPA